MKRLILALALINTVNAAFAVNADFIFCKPVSEGDRPRQIRVNGSPIGGGQGCSDESQVLTGELAQSEHEYDYAFRNGAVAYEPQLQLGSSTPLPQPRQFQTLVMTDPNIPLASKAELMKYFALLEQNADNLTGLRNGWQILIAAFGDSWLTPEVIQIVQDHAITAHMPLAE